MSRVRYEILIVRIFFSVSLLKSSSPSPDTTHTSNWSVGRFVAKLYTYLWAQPQLAFVIRYNILCLIGSFFILIIIPFVPTHFIAHFYMLASATKSASILPDIWVTNEYFKQKRNTTAFYWRCTIFCIFIVAHLGHPLWRYPQSSRIRGPSCSVFNTFCYLVCCFLYCRPIR